MLWLRFYRRWLRADSKRLGRWGERHAASYLRKEGYGIITRNWRCKVGEIDVIAADPSGAIVFVEVKTRRNELWAMAQNAVDNRKQKRMKLAAESFLKSYKIKDKPLRFDVIAIILPEKGPIEIRHYENAFRASYR